MTTATQAPIPVPWLNTFDADSPHGDWPYCPDCRDTMLTFNFPDHDEWGIPTVMTWDCPDCGWSDEGCGIWDEADTPQAP